MGFFSELKEDLSQAVNELMPTEEDLENAGKPENAESPSEDVSLEEMLKNIDEMQASETAGSADAAEVSGTALEAEAAETVIDTVEQFRTESQEPEPSLEDMLAAALEAIPERGETGADEKPEEAKQELAQHSATESDLNEQAEPETSYESDAGARPAETAGQEAEQETAEAAWIAEEQEASEEIREESKGAEKKMDNFENREVVDETAVITQGMYIRGDIMSEGSADIVGTVEGNIDVLGKLNITGHIDGNSKAAEIYAEGAKINGDIISEGAVKIGDSSVIIGNITAKSAAIAGAVKGDIDVQGPVILDSSAIVMGNIKSKSVQINNGAVIEGMCSQCYADVSPTSFFDDYKPETKSSKKAGKAAEKNHA